jgi:hypothetical protein
VLRGGELRKVAFHIHARIHLANRRQSASFTSIAVSHRLLIEGGRMTLAHHNNLILDDRIAYDDDMTGPAFTNDEDDRLAARSAIRPSSSWPTTA